MQVEIKDFKTGEISPEPYKLNEAIFDMEFNPTLVHQIINAFQAAGRQGTKQNKSRSEVSGGGKKPWAQKGTGRARAGTSRSPIWRKGGVTFAAKPRDYSQKVNRKMYRKALSCILAEQLRRGHIMVAENIDADTHKTKWMLERIKHFGWDSVTIITDVVSENLYLSARNIPKVYLLDDLCVNPVILYQSSKLLFSVGALNKIQEQLA